MEGQASCKQCPPQSLTLWGSGATSDTDCACRIGYTASRQEDGGGLECTRCPPRSTTKSTNSTSALDCICADGFWNPSMKSDLAADQQQPPQPLQPPHPPQLQQECLPCPQFSTCRSGKAPRTKAGYWRVPWRNESLHTNPTGSVVSPRLKCLEPSACVGARPNSGENESAVPEGCLEFHSGPLCAACGRNAYKQAGSYLCLPCFDAVELSGLFVAFVVMSALGIILAMTVATVADGGEASAVDVIILKIALNSAVISAAASSFPLAWPPIVIKMFQFYAVASASAMGDSLSADCVVRTGALRPVQAWALSMVVITPTTVLLWATSYAAMARCRCKSKFLRVYFPVASLVTLLMAHPVITKAAIKLVACRPVAGRYFLETDFNVSCSSDEYRLWVRALAMPMLLLFTFGIPGIYAWAMYRHVRKGRIIEERAVYGFLFSGFRENMWWFELWNTLRKSLFTMGAVLFGPYGTFMQTWAALCLLLFYVVVFSLAQPYEQVYLNRLERSALSINCVTLLCGLGLFTNDQASEARNPALAMALSVVIVMLNAVFLTNVINTLRVYGQHCAKCRKSRASPGGEAAARNDKQIRAGRLMQRVQRSDEFKLVRAQTKRGSLRYNVKVAVHMKKGRDAVAIWTAENSRARSKLQAQKLAAQARLKSRIRRRSHKPPKIEAGQVVPLPKKAGGVKVAMAPVSSAAVLPASDPLVGRSPAPQKWETHVNRRKKAY